MFVEQKKTLDVNAETTSKHIHVCLIRRLQPSPPTFITLPLHQPKFVLLQPNGYLFLLRLQRKST